MALTGGFVAQEIVKAMTLKFYPIKQLAIINVLDVVDDVIDSKETP